MTTLNRTPADRSASTSALASAVSQRLGTVVAGPASSDRVFIEAGRPFPAVPLWGRLVMLISACAIGFGPALVGLAGRLGTGSATELAVLVPAVAVLAAVLLLARSEDPAIAFPVSAADATVAVWLAMLSLGASWWLPRVFGNDTARLGLDLFGLPIFAAALGVLLLGGRTVFLTRRAIGIAVLASPPVLAAGGGWIERAAIAIGWPSARLSAQIAGVEVMEQDGAAVLDLGGPLAASDLAGSGASIVIAVLLVGTTVALVGVGSLRRRLLWVGAVGIAGVLANGVRLAVIVAVAQATEDDIANRLLNPWVGLGVAATFAVVVLLVLRRAGLISPPVEGSAADRARRSMPELQIWRVVGAIAVTMAMALIAGTTGVVGGAS